MRNSEFLPGLIQLHDVTAIERGQLFRCETFYVHLISRYRCGCSLESIEHRQRPAAVEMRVLGCIGNDCADIEGSTYAMLINVNARLLQMLNFRKHPVNPS